MSRDWRAYSGDSLAASRARLAQALTVAQWKAKSWAAAILLGDRDWGSIRFGLILAGVVLFLLFGRVTEAIATRPWVEQIRGEATPTLQPLVGGVLGFMDALLTRQALRHALPPVAGIVLALLVGAAFVNDLFEVGDLSLAYGYLRASLFGNGYPILEVKDCKIDPADAGNPLAKIGGPGFVKVGVGLAAVCETAGGPADVLGTGLHFLRRFETLREVFDLRDQFRTVAEIKAMTKDGIPVTARDVQMSFRLRTRHNRMRTESDPYPYSIAALRDAAYNKVVGTGGSAPWPDAVAGAIGGQLRSMIARRRLDDLIGPTAADARAVMQGEFFNLAARKKYARMGAEVLWVSLGHFENPHEVAVQRIRTWQAGWQRLGKITEAEAQAERLRMEEHLRGEAIIHLVESLERSAEFTGDSGMTAADRFFVLMAETLEAYARRGSLTGGKDSGMLRLARELRRIPGASGSASALELGSLDDLIIP